jgi:hypothetical protein
MARTVTLMLCALALFCGTAAAQTGRKSVPASEVNGTFRMNFAGKFKGNSNEIRIWALGHNKLKLGMDLVYPYIVNKELSANIGELDGEATITGDTAVYSSKQFGACEITIRFLHPGTIKVTQSEADFDCGFGHNVSADGTYHKVSSKKPTFDRPDR